MGMVLSQTTTPMALGFLYCVKRDSMTKAALTRKHLIEVVAYSFRGPVHYHLYGEHGGVQADTVLELRVYILQATGS